MYNVCTSFLFLSYEIVAYLLDIVYLQAVVSRSFSDVSEKKGEETRTRSTRERRTKPYKSDPFCARSHAESRVARGQQTGLYDALANTLHNKNIIFTSKHCLDVMITFLLFLLFIFILFSLFCYIVDLLCSYDIKNNILMW